MDQNRADFREVFETHKEPVFRFLWRLTGNPHDSEDLLQETFVTYWRKREQFRGEGSLLSYLRRIAFRTYLNARARLSAKQPPLSLEAVAEPEMPGGEGVAAERDDRRFLIQKVRDALSRLPDGTREAFLLFRFEGMAVAEVAQVTESPIRTVESRLRRAHQAVARRLSKYRDLLLPR